MKVFFVFILMSSAPLVYADSGCEALNSATGRYRQVSNTCAKDKSEMTFTSYQIVDVLPKTQDGAYSQFWIYHSTTGYPNGAVGFGPSTNPKNAYKCLEDGSAVSVDDGRDKWLFSASGLIFSSGECVANFVKTN